MKLNDNLAKILDKKGMSPADLCRLVDIHRSTIYRYVSGTCIPRSDHLHKLASALNESEGYLLGYEDEDSTRLRERSFTITLQLPQNVEIRGRVQAVSEHEAVGKVFEHIPTATYENIIEIKEDI